MSRVTFEELLEAGAHFGHLRRKWNPAMAPYIFAEKNGVHIIDLSKTVVKLDEAATALKQIARSGKKILFVATKKQAKDIVSDKVEGWSGVHDVYRPGNAQRPGRGLPRSKAGHSPAKCCQSRPAPRKKSSTRVAQH